MGGSGNDTLVGGIGNDTLEGAAGIDTASYWDAPGAIRADLTDGIAFGAAGGGRLHHQRRHLGTGQLGHVGQETRLHLVRRVEVEVRRTRRVAVQAAELEPADRVGVEPVATT